MTGLRSAVEKEGSRGAVRGIFCNGNSAPWSDAWGEYRTCTAPVDMVASICKVQQWAASRNDSVNARDSEKAYLIDAGVP